MILVIEITYILLNGFYFLGINFILCGFNIGMKDYGERFFLGEWFVMYFLL